MPVPHVIQRPYYYSFSKNQITWRFYVPSPTDAGCKLQFKLFADTATDIPADQRVFETELRPAADGFLNATVDDIIDSMIDLSVPVVTTSNILAAQNLKKITIQYRRVTDTDIDTAWNDNEPAIYVVKGGIELLKHDYNNYFLNYHAPNKVFATWLPKNRLVGIADDWWMSILFTNQDITAPVLTARKLRTFLEYADGSTGTVYDVVPSTGFAYLLYHFNVGKIVREAADPDKLLWRFTVQVVGNADVSLLFSEAYTMYADYRQFYDYKIFNFYNSLGGMDHVRILAESEESYTRGFIEADLFANSNTVGSPADKQYFQANFTRLNSTKTDAGYRHTKSEVLAYQELLTSGLVFEIWPNSNKYRIIGLLNKSGKLIKTTDKRYGFSIEWRYPFTEQVYTPEVDLGVGFDACIPVEIDSEAALPDGKIGVPYYYTVEATGTLPITIADIVKPAWMTITLDVFTISFTGTPSEAATGLEASFSLLNCSGSSTDFSDTIDITEDADSEFVNMQVVNNVATCTITGVTPAFYTVVAGAFPLSSTGTVDCHHAGYMASISIFIHGTLDNNTLIIKRNGITQDTISGINSIGNRTFAPFSFTPVDIILITLN